MSARIARDAGFTLVEMMVTITILAILMALAMPSMSTWVKNSQVRAAGDALQNGLRLAQAESLRRSRQVVFSLTDSPSPAVSLTAKEDGKYWSINTIQLTGETTDVPAFVESGVLGVPGNDVSIAGPAAICFSSLGRLASNSSTGVSGAECSVDVDGATYNLTLAGADRNLRVRVAVGGQVRMCDPNKTLSASVPDGC